MLDFQAVNDKKITIADLAADLRPHHLADLTNEMVDKMQELIAGCVDADVTFQPVDPDAYDAYAETDEETEMAWTLGHVIVHTTASAEESAALAAEMARGVPNHGRSRYEIPWQTITTIAQCRQRLEESRRIRLASLKMWPAEPHLDLSYKPWRTAPEINAIGRFVLGLKHDYDHLGQLADIVDQAHATRTG